MIYLSLHMVSSIFHTPWLIEGAMYDANSLSITSRAVCMHSACHLNNSILSGLSFALQRTSLLVSFYTDQALESMSLNELASYLESD